MSDLHHALVETVRALNRLGINQGTAGNASVRLPGAGGGLLITPSGVPYDDLAPDDLVTLHPDGSHACPRRHAPSSEWRFHRDLLARRPDLAAVVHAHGRAAATLACLRRPVPPFHYMVAAAGGKDIRCAPYATFGTEALSEHVVAAMAGRRACLLANHGLVAAGASLPQALAVAVEVETLCDVYWRCLQIGEPALLSDAEMDAVLAQFARGYGAGPAFGGSTPNRNGPPGAPGDRADLES